jgi:hypothetical protein
VVGISPPDVTWSVELPALGSSIDPSSGLFTAGGIEGTVLVVATSVANPSLFKRAPVVVVEGCVAPVTSSSPGVRGPMGGVGSCEPTVTISPPSVNLALGATQQFAATVIGAANQAVVWSATGGTITSSGFFTAPTNGGLYTVTARSVEVPTATGSATVVVGTPAACSAPAYGLAGSVTRVENVGSGEFSRTSRASAFVTLCFSPSGGSVVVQQVTGTLTQHVSDPERTVDCSGVFAVRFPHPTLPGQFVESRYSDPRFDSAGVMTSANLFGAVQGTCTATEGTSSFTNVQPLGQGTHTIQNGRIVEIVFDRTGSEVTTTGRFLPVPP